MNGVYKTFNSENIHAGMNAVIAGHKGLTVHSSDMNITVRADENCTVSLGMNAIVFAEEHSKLECDMNGILFGGHGSIFKGDRNTVFIYKCESGAIVQEQVNNLKPNTWYTYDEDKCRWVMCQFSFKNTKSFRTKKVEELFVDSYSIRVGYVIKTRLHFITVFIGSYEECRKIYKKLEALPKSDLAKEIGLPVDLTIPSPYRDTNISLHLVSQKTVNSNFFDA